MDFYPHHIKSFAMQAGHLSAAEEGLYRRMLDWIYYHERPLPPELPEVLRLIRIQADTNEAVLVGRVLQEFFELQKDGWHQQRADEEIELYHQSRVDGLSPGAVRQRKWREKKRANGAASRNVSALLRSNPDITVSEGLDGDGVRGGDTSPIEPLGVNPVETYHETLPRHNGDVSETDIDLETLKTHTAAEHLAPVPFTTPVKISEAIKAIRSMGLAAVNPGDPRFRALVAAGVEPELWAWSAAEAVARRKGWAYALKVAENRLAEGWHPPPRPKHAQEAAKSGAGGAGGEWLRVMCPQLLSGAPRPDFLDEEAGDVGKPAP